MSARWRDYMSGKIGKERNSPRGNGLRKTVRDPCQWILLPQIFLIERWIERWITDQSEYTIYTLTSQHRDNGLSDSFVLSRRLFPKCFKITAIIITLSPDHNNPYSTWTETQMKPARLLISICPSPSLASAPGSQVALTRLRLFGRWSQRERVLGPRFPRTDLLWTHSIILTRIEMEQ